MKRVGLIGLLIALGVLNLQSRSLAQSPSTDDVLNQKNTKDNRGKNPQAREEQNTYLLLDSRNRNQRSGAQNTFDLGVDLTIGKERANTMVKIVQDEEMKKALEKITLHGNEVLERNEDVKTPVAVIAGAVSLWAGRTMRLFRANDVEVSTHVEGRSRSGDLRMKSPLLNGQLKFDEINGNSIGVNRSISSFNTSAGWQYNLRNQAMSTQINQQIAPNLNFSVGTEQNSSTTDSTARLIYELHF